MKFIKLSGMLPYVSVGQYRAVLGMQKTSVVLEWNSKSYPTIKKFKFELEFTSYKLCRAGIFSNIEDTF